MKRFLAALSLLVLAGAANGQTRLLDTHTDAYAAYSLRLLDSDFADSSAVRVRRDSDNAEQDIGFTGDSLDVTALETFCAATDCGVVKFYSQIAGDPALETGYLNDIAVSNVVDPYIVYAGSVVRDTNGRPVIDFAGNAALYLPTALGTPVKYDSSSVYMKLSTDSTDAGGADYQALLQSGTNTTANTSYTWNEAVWGQIYFRNTQWTDPSDYLTYVGEETIFSYHVAGSTTDSTLAYARHELIEKISAGITGETRSQFVLGSAAKDNNDPGWHGKIGELIMLPYRQGPSAVLEIYDDINAFWGVGPTTYYSSSLFPQKTNEAIELYEWFLANNDSTLFSLHEEFAGVDSDSIATANGAFTGLSDDQVADIWLPIAEPTLSSATRYESCWYVLDCGNGKGIEALGDYPRIIHDPVSGGTDPFKAGYEGNPPRSWGNEPCHWANVHVHRSGLSEGWKGYQSRALKMRSMSITFQDMIMYQNEWDGGSAAWPDMFGRAALSWAQSLRYCGDVLPDSTREAAYTILLEVANKIKSWPGVRGANTNLDTFMIHGLATMYGDPAADSTLKARAAEAIKASLLGYPDGEVGVKHKVFSYGNWHPTGEVNTGGAWHPAGYIAEGGQPDIFYQGESKLQLFGALAAVMKRGTREVPEDVIVLKHVAESMVEFEAYQMAFDPGGDSPCCGGLISEKIFLGPGGYPGRTGDGVPSGQADYIWRDVYTAHVHPAGRFRVADYGWQQSELLPSVASMKSTISSQLQLLNDAILTPVVTSDPGAWDFWSPWVKPVPYLPPSGWYSEIKSIEARDPDSFIPPTARPGYYYNKTFGGYPTGEEYWAYKDSIEGIDFGFFIEAHPRQGTYGGWYGGKIEAFWSDSTGTLIINRHGKTGCDGLFEDSGCWTNLDSKAGHHVWGRDENGNGFTTLMLKGEGLQREAVYKTDSTEATVWVKNYFNDPYWDPEQTSSRTGEQTGSELEGVFNVTNTFTAVEAGVKVTHLVESDQTDSLSTLDVGIPILLRKWNSIDPGDKPQASMSDTSIEYDSLGTWASFPGDGVDADTLPDYVTTSAIRLGRDYNDGNGPRYGYISFAVAESVRLGDGVYEDPYQTSDRVQVIHVDLHGSSGTNILAPASTSTTYTIQVVDPTQ